MGTVLLTSSMQKLTASKESFLCGDEIAIIMLGFSIETSPLN